MHDSGRNRVLEGLPEVGASERSFLAAVQNVTVSVGRVVDSELSGNFQRAGYLWGRMQ